MALRDLMLEDLRRGLATVRDGQEIVPTWRIIAPDGTYLILTRFDPDEPEQRERMWTAGPRADRRRDQATGMAQSPNFR